MFRLLLLSTLISMAFGGAIEPIYHKWDTKIVGGKETTIDKYPYQVSVTHIFFHSCGGSIINKNTVITAAHCTEKRTPFSLQVRAGTTSSNDNLNPGTLYMVDKIIQHPEFSMATVDNDISILKLKKSIIFTDKIQPIPLQLAGVDVPETSLVTITGWGALLEGTHSVNILREVQMNVIGKNECQQAYGDKYKITEHMFCAQSAGKDACQGDSGGPIAYEGRLVGIVSWGIGCARPEYPGVFTRIAAMRPWIDKYINE